MTMKASLRTGKAKKYNSDWYASKPKKKKIGSSKRQTYTLTLEYERSGRVRGKHAYFFYNERFGGLWLIEDKRLYDFDFKKRLFKIKGKIGGSCIVSNWELLEVV